MIFSNLETENCACVVHVYVLRIHVFLPYFLLSGKAHVAGCYCAFVPVSHRIESVEFWCAACGWRLGSINTCRVFSLSRSNYLSFFFNLKTRQSFRWCVLCSRCTEIPASPSDHDLRSCGIPSSYTCISHLSHRFVMMISFIALYACAILS